jgi:hypothetical protein
MNKDLEMAKAFDASKKYAISSILDCYHPECNEKSINSHILQESGILSKIAPNRYLRKRLINKYYKNDTYFQTSPISKAFSFNGFCYKHDNDLFELIEKEDINFKDYNSLIRFTLRTIYYEKYLKERNIKMNEYLVLNHSDLFNINILLNGNSEDKLGISDLEKTQSLIWNDINTGTESFIFNFREIEKNEICLASFFTYDTTEELNRIGQNEISNIFVIMFPYKDKSLLIMGYEKTDAKKVKGYVNSFFKENEKRLKRMLTNILLFNCENWVCSERFYNERIKQSEGCFFKTLEFSANAKNKKERNFFDLNIFEKSFSGKLNIWLNEYYYKL